ncbi:AAA family ATPase [Anaeromicropila herbilytica]|uniref:AAA family ATPase n=1 Tax=Anaeromicropila herbilytica TaxID=2785025 RepID=UPI00232A6F75|nr:MoxR family ATPase [Anaeromicropila herbilytica]
MEYQNAVCQIINNIEKVIIGKKEIIELSITSLLAGGHLLLEDVPGVGKTTLANAIARTIDCGFTRIQFTPDTLPSDITGLSIYNMQTGVFEYSKGAIMNNIILADEINRTSPKTQASLLEAMEEGQVSVDGVTYELPKPFMVVATQNPVDYLGTYNLPEAQLDRFLMKLSIGYPSEEDEKTMVLNFLMNQRLQSLEPVVDTNTILKMQDEVKQIQIHNDLISYMIQVIHESRKNSNITLGASPRATLALTRASQAVAYMAGRDYVIPDDLKKMASPVLKHRLMMSPDARLNKQTADTVVETILRKVSVPIF